MVLLTSGQQNRCRALCAKLLQAHGATRSWFCHTFRNVDVTSKFATDPGRSHHRARPGGGGYTEGEQDPEGHRKHFTLPLVGFVVIEEETYHFLDASILKPWFCLKSKTLSLKRKTSKIVCMRPQTQSSPTPIPPMPPRNDPHDPQALSPKPLKP